MTWLAFVANMLWIIASATALSTLSHVYCQAWRIGEPVRVALRRPSYQIAFDLAGVSFSLGMLLAAPVGVLTIVWLVLVVSFVAQAMQSWSVVRRQSHPTS